MKIKKLLPRLIILVVVTVMIALAPTVFVAARGNSSEEKVSTGDNLDIYSGRCGVYLMNALVDGQVTLGHEDRSQSRLKLIQDPCKFDYEVDGKSLSSYNGILVYYINLTASQRSRWLEGGLGMYVNDSPCSANYIPSAGQFGRLACLSQKIGSYGLVDISVNEEDDDDDEKKTASLPDGKAISFSQTIDLNKGRCGAYLHYVPQDGFVQVDNHCVLEKRTGWKFIQKACELSYKDPTDMPIETYNGYMLNYINLTLQQQRMWQEGNLSMVVYDGDSWSDCNPYWMPGGVFGRLVCRTNTVGMFGLVDISIDEDDED
jgi:hypothetical protein